MNLRSTFSFVWEHFVFCSQHIFLGKRMHCLPDSHTHIQERLLMGVGWAITAPVLGWSLWSSIWEALVGPGPCAPPTQCRIGQGLGPPQPASLGFTEQPGHEVCLRTIDKFNHGFVQSPFGMTVFKISDFNRSVSILGRFLPVCDWEAQLICTAQGPEHLDGV